MKGKLIMAAMFAAREVALPVVVRVAATVVGGIILWKATQWLIHRKSAATPVAS